MIHPTFFDPRNTLNLFELDEKLKFISSLYSKQMLPKVLMLSGNKGSGKSTLINHFLHSIFDKENYNMKNFTQSSTSTFAKQFKNNIFPNIIYIKGADFRAIKVDDIRSLKEKILKSTISNNDRFIIFDDIELFNQNSLNALLKIIEEPSKKNYFFLINNKSKSLLETINSRALEIKIILSENQRIKIIKNLVNSFKLNLDLDPITSQLTPGNFVKFNYICNQYNILPTKNFIKNLSLILDIYKKNKDVLFINFLFFMADFYLKYLKEKNLLKNNQIFDLKNYIFDNLNSYMMYNINRNSLINALNEKLKYE